MPLPLCRVTRQCGLLPKYFWTLVIITILVSPELSEKKWQWSTCITYTIQLPVYSPDSVTIKNGYHTNLQQTCMTYQQLTPVFRHLLLALMSRLRLCHTCDFIAQFCHATLSCDKVAVCNFACRTLQLWHINKKWLSWLVISCLCNKFAVCAMQLHTAILLCNKGAQQNRVIKSQVWHRPKSHHLQLST